MSKHTPGPWQTNGLLVEVYGGKIMTPTVCDCGVSCVIPEEEKFSNARRIVACVNACAGIETERLESGSPEWWGRYVRDDRPAMEREIAKLRAEREELRKAITGLLDAANRNVGGMVPGGVAYWCHSALGLLAEKA